MKFEVGPWEKFGMEILHGIEEYVTSQHFKKNGSKKLFPEGFFIIFTLILFVR